MEKNHVNGNEIVGGERARNTENNFFKLKWKPSATSLIETNANAMKANGKKDAKIDYTTTKRHRKHVMIVDCDQNGSDGSGMVWSRVQESGRMSETKLPVAQRELHVIQFNTSNKWKKETKTLCRVCVLHILCIRYSALWSLPSTMNIICFTSLAKCPLHILNTIRKMWRNEKWEWALAIGHFDMCSVYAIALRCAVLCCVLCCVLCSFKMCYMHSLFYYLKQLI